MARRLELSGDRFGEYTVIERAPNKAIGCDRSITAWLCKCSCGNLQVVSTQDLVKGDSKRCSLCRNRGKNNGRYSHGKVHSRLYRIWSNMKSRCENKDFNEYESYGGRGICVCDEWKNDFRHFNEWAMNHGYRDDLTIDRINVNGNYCPENCRFTTMKNQMNNTTRNHYITYDGQTKTMSEWADVLGVNYYSLRSRINILKWDINRAFTTPFRSKRKSAGLF